MCSVRVLLSIGLLTLGAVPGVAAAQDPSGFRVEKAALFKNGYGFVAGGIAAAPGSETVTLDSPPEAMLGTFWLGLLPDGASVTGVWLEEAELSEPRPAMSFADMIAANPGRNVAITTVEGTSAGTLLPVEPSPLSAGPAAASPETARVESQPDICLFKTADGIQAVRLSEIRALRFDGDAVTTASSMRKVKRLVCRLDRPTQGGALPVHFFQRGVSWLPAYEIVLLADKQARVRMRGSIINDALDLNDAQVSFIAGHPNLQFASIPEVTLTSTSMETFHQQLSDAFNPARFGVPAQSMLTQNTAAWIASNGSVPIDWQGGSSALPLDGAFNEDLFYYTPVPVTLPKGGRGAWLIAENTCPYEHIYTWEVPETTFTGQGQSMPAPGAPLESEPVWHSIRLTNTGQQPWSTGTTFVLRDGQPLSQDTMNYTGPGQETRVRITKALGLSAQKEERETAREENARRRYSSMMDRITVQGDLRIRNTTDEPAPVEVRKQVRGTVQNTTPEATVTRRAEGVNGENPSYTIQWQFLLEPGQETQLTYTFQAYV